MAPSKRKTAFVRLGNGNCRTAGQRSRVAGMQVPASTAIGAVGSPSCCQKVIPHVKDVVEGPANVAGRIAGIRIRSRQGDFFIVGCYFPVRIHPGADEYERFQRTIDTMTEWIHGQLNARGRRTCPILCMDLNDHIGWTKVQSGLLIDSCEPSLIGPYGRGEQHYAGEQMSRLMTVHELYAPFTFGRFPPTYYHPSGSSTRIDHMLLPVGMAPLLRACFVEMRKLPQVQHTPDAQPRDHAPTYIDFGGAVPFETDSEFWIALFFRAPSSRSPTWSGCRFCPSSRCGHCTA